MTKTQPTTNAAGALAQTCAFDSFGEQTASSGSLTNPFQYTGREFDPETSLYYYRARYYDPTTRRFLSEDPIGSGDESDLYRYVKNNPLNLRDPLGLCPGQDCRALYLKCVNKVAAILGKAGESATQDYDKDLKKCALKAILGPEAVAACVEEALNNYVGTLAGVGLAGLVGIPICDTEYACCKQGKDFHNCNACPACQDKSKTK